MKKRKIKKIYCLLLVTLIVIVGVVVFKNSDNKEVKSNNKLLMPNFVGKNITDIEEFMSDNNLSYEVSKIQSDDYDKGIITKQSIEPNQEISNKKIILTVSLGKISKEYYSENKVNELGRIPVMMYHGIQNKKNDETNYTGGNIDKDGYQRTSEAFTNDLEFYYKNNYRMIRLDDYINGIIDVEIGKSPIVLTFDDGLKNNISVTGLDEKGNIIIDPNSAVGILESFKKKYPDYNVTATFFLNSNLFEQEEYNEKIIKWLIDNGYDIGNHTLSHVDFTKIDSSKTQKEVGGMYKKLDSIIKDKYVKIIALPYGSPYKKDHNNFDYILNGTYDGFNYETVSALRVGWESDYSPFSDSFDKTFIKRIRAYDNDGVEFDIQMNFKLLENNRYISDGDKDKIVVKEENKDNIKNNYDLKVVTY